MKMELLRSWKKSCKAIILVSVVCLALLSLIAWITGGLERLVGWDRGKEEEYHQRDEEEFHHLNYQISNIVCPARPGQQLQDYWECLFKSSLTREGKLQHEKLLQERKEKMVYEFTRKQDAKRKPAPDSLGTTTEQKKPRKRVRRQYTNQINIVKGDPIHDYKLAKMYWYGRDYAWSLVYFKLSVKSECQPLIQPGISIEVFMKCVRNIAAHNPRLQAFGGGNSFDFTFQPTTYPPIDLHLVHQSKEYPFILLKGSKWHIENNITDYLYVVDFDPLHDEEKLENFGGADPYLGDAWSVYRYRYDLQSGHGQEQPGWSYTGRYPALLWHQLRLERFYLPIKTSTDVRKLPFTSDFVESYPGIGDLTADIATWGLQTPYNYRWTKDKGEYIYTRYLLPLLDSSDLEYYSRKGYVSPQVTIRPDVDVLQDIIDGLQNYLNKSDEWIDDKDVNGFNWNPLFQNDTPPFSKAYENFLSHFWGTNMADYKSLLPAYVSALAANGWPPNTRPLYRDYELVRQLLRRYVEAVIVQEACVRQMVSEIHYRLTVEEDLKELFEKVAQAPDTGCRVIQDPNDPDFFSNETFYLKKEALSNLYDTYFDRKEVRQRYSLPEYPIAFPICQNNDPSPINIRTSSGRQSSLRDYQFGQAAYRLNRFFMFFPLDGSPLLTVGIVDGQRLDESSVLLSGGAVKGQNLTFQYMHIHFSDSWKKVGSEHWIDGKGAPMELQMVFTISGSADAIKYWHVLARVANQLFQFREKLVIILSVLVDVLKDDDAVKKKIEQEDLHQDPYMFEPLAQAAFLFRRMNKVNPQHEDPRGYVSKDPVFRFIDFIPRKSGNFYTYRGSLSWPPCFGYVIWSVYDTRLYMSARQFNQFAKIPAYGIQDTNFASDNFRKFSDIYVKEEDDAGLSFSQIEALKKKRTVDRYILIGYHDVSNEGFEADSEGVVGEPIYYFDDEENRNGSPDHIKLGPGIWEAIIAVYVYNNFIF